MRFRELLIDRDGQAAIAPLTRITINEVVLHAPVETVLAPYINRAPSEPTKRWLAQNFRNWVLKQPQNLYKLPYLPINATEKQKKAFEFNDLWDIRLTPQTQTMIEHIMDFFEGNPNPPRLDRMSVENVVQAADLAVKQYNAKVAKELKKAGNQESEADIKTLVEYPGGYRIVEMLTQKALDREGNIMSHCVGSHHGEYLKSGQRRMFSLRDAQNEPHATIEVNADNMRTTEIKGKGNRAPVRRYWPMLRDFVEKYGVMVQGDHHNIGLLSLPNPTTGQWVTMTQEQFRDMILDPNHAGGQEIIKSYEQHGRTRGQSHDITIGLFSALYGSDRLNDKLITEAFSTMPEHAVAVVEHYGNRFNDHQLTVAFTALASNRGSYGGRDALDREFKAMLIATKPSTAVITDLLAVNDVPTGQLARKLPVGADVTFISALAQVLPQAYTEYLAAGGPQAIQNELNQNNERAAGPFFVFCGTDQLSQQMVEGAFEYRAEDALKRLKKDKVVFTDEMTKTAIDAIESTYSYTRSQDLPALLDDLVQTAKPSSEALKQIFDKHAPADKRNNQRSFPALLLMAVRKYDPDVLDAATLEKALLAIDHEDLYAQYLADNEPSLEFQSRLFALDLDSFKTHEKPLRMRFLRIIDPSLYEKLVQVLRPAPFSTKLTKHKSVADKKNPGKYRSISYEEEMTPEQRGQAISEARREAIRRFLKMLEPMLLDPTGDTYSAKKLNPESEKFQNARAAFKAMGKGPLFANALTHLGWSMTKRDVVHNDSVVHAERFIQDLDKLRAVDIAELIDGGYSGARRALFKDLINHAPHRVPEVMMTKTRSSLGRDSRPHFDKLDFPGLDKEKTFEALEAVWATDKMPEGYKDKFTVEAFKRFKPKPAQLMSMLKNADNEAATRYVLKKTKKPSDELLMFVVEHFPELMGEVQVPVSEKVATTVFETQPRLAVALMNRDLRGYGSDSKSKWARKDYRSRIDPEGEAYALYDRAAKAAGKSEFFHRYIKQSQLEELHPRLVHWEEKKGPNRAHVVDMDLLRQHIDEYSARTLIHVAEHDESGQALVLYFNQFKPEKLATLIKHDLLKEPHWWSYHDQGKRVRPVQVVAAQIDPQKLRDVVLATKDVGAIDKLLLAMIDAGYEFDDDLIIHVLKHKTSGYSENAWKKLLADDVSDRVKDYVADNIPHEMDEIKVPNAHMVKVLFDQYGHFEKSYEKNDKHRVSYFFTSTVGKWFSSTGSSIGFKYRENPEARRLLTAEAKRRGGQAPTILTAVFRAISASKAKSEEETATHGYSHASLDSANVPMLPPGARVKR